MDEQQEREKIGTPEKSDEPGEPKSETEVFPALLGGLVIALIFFSMYLYSEHHEKKEVSYVEQQKHLQQLETLENNLKEFAKYVAVEKSRVAERQSLLRRLETKEFQLRPIVEANEEAIHAILDYQRQQDNKERWIQHLLAFLLGILASIIASYIYSRFSHSPRKSR